MAIWQYGLFVGFKDSIKKEFGKIPDYILISENEKDLWIDSNVLIGDFASLIDNLIPRAPRHSHSPAKAEVKMLEINEYLRLQNRKCRANAFGELPEARKQI